MPPATAMSYVYCTEADVQSILSADGETGRLDDDGDGANSATELGYLTQAIRWATARCNLYLLGKHEAADLAQSWIVNQYCTILACHFLASRRGNSVPGSIESLYEEAMEDLKSLGKGELQLADTAMRDTAFPSWSNVRVDVLYGLKKVRVERPISGAKGDRSGQIVDRRADIIGPYETL